jgi:DNA-binding IclR family transcriptional regulator
MASYSNQSLERGFAILEYLGASTKGRGIAEVSRATGLHRATAHRLLEVLCGLGYVYKSPDDRKYWVGYRLHTFGHRSSMIARITHHARPFLRTLAHELDETVHLGALEGTQAFFCDRIATGRSLRMDIRVGDYFDAHATAIGKALLALRDPGEVRDAYRHAPPRAHTGRTITSVETLLRDLAAARKAGYAVADEELMPGVRSVAAALINPRGRAACAISVSGPKARLADDRLSRVAARLRETATAITDRMLAADREA